MYKSPPFLNLSSPLVITQFILSLIIIGISVAVIISWSVGSLEIIKLFSFPMQMSFLTALYFFLYGTFLLFESTRLKYFSLVLAIILLLLSTATFAEKIFPIEIGLSRISTYFLPENNGQLKEKFDLPNTFEFLFSSFALFLLFSFSRRTNVIVASLGSCLFGFGLFGITVYFFNILEEPNWGVFNQISFLTETCFILLGFGLVIIAWKKESPKKIRLPIWMPVVVILFSLSITINLYLAVSSQQNVSLNFALETRASGVEHIIIEDIEERILSFKELVARSNNDFTNNLKDRESDVLSIMNIFDDIRSIHLEDINSEMSWFVSYNGVAPKKQVLSRVISREDKPTVSEVIELENGKQGFHVYTPIYVNGTHKGFLVGAIELEDFLDDVLPIELKNDFNVVVVENNQEVFKTKLTETQQQQGLFTEKTVKFYETDWKVRVYPETPLSNRLDPILPEIYLLTGTVISILLGLFLYYFLNSRNAIRHNNIVNRRLSREVERRKREIERRKELADNLVKARDAALESSRAKAAFIANMSHEIRTPMNGVIGASELLFDTQLSKEQLEYVRTIDSSGEILMNLINKILDLSKIEENKMRLERINFDLSETIERLNDLFVPMAEKKRIIFKAQLNEKIQTSLLGDQNKLQQVLINLISNAIKFTDIGTVMVEVNILNETDEEIELSFIVMDTGIGILPENTINIFEPFTQADVSTTRKYGGTGLGLTICKRLVELMGGKIGVSSVPKVGSTFWFTLTLKKYKKPSVEPNFLFQISERFPAGLPLAENSPNQLPVEAKCVLLVEDNPTNQMVTKRQIEKLGLQIEIADNGQKALKKFKQKPYDIILMDCQMPVLDGYETTKEIRVLEKTMGRLTPIIALTAHASAEDSAKCFAAGMNGYLCKPVRQEKLSKIFKLWLRENSGRKSQTAISEENTEKSINQTNHDDEIGSILNLLVEECGRDGVVEIIRVFLDDMLKSIILTQQLIRQPDKYEDLAREAHRLKGACLNFGATRLANLATELEKVAHVNDFNLAFILVEKIASEFEILFELLQLALSNDFKHESLQ